MADTPTVLDELTDVILERRQHDPATTRWGRARAQAEVVLDWLGQLDPDADPALVVWHLRNDRAEIARLRGALIRVNEQRLYAERMVGSLPLDVGEHFERRRQETNELVRAVIGGGE